jgi:hypothetical protein
MVVEVFCKMKYKLSAGVPAAAVIDLFAVSRGISLR